MQVKWIFWYNISQNSQKTCSVYSTFHFVESFFYSLKMTRISHDIFEFLNLPAVMIWLSEAWLYHKKSFIECFSSNFCISIFYAWKGKINHMADISNTFILSSSCLDVIIFVLLFLWMIWKGAHGIQGSSGERGDNGADVSILGFG